MVPLIPSLRTRREARLRGGAGFGALALAGMLSGDAALGADASPFASPLPQLPARARSVIFLFMEGGRRRTWRPDDRLDRRSFHAIENRLHVHDLHATQLHLLGLDNMQLTYLHKGRPERPTQNEGAAYKQITGRALG